MKKQYVVLTASVILFVLVRSGISDTDVNDTVTDISSIVTTEGTTIANHLDLSSVLSAAIENAKSANLLYFLPHPIQSFVSLIKEIFRIVVTLGPSLPNLLLHPLSVPQAVLPHLLALVLIALTFVPVLILPSKIIALILSIFALFSDYWAPFDKTYLASL
jgi:hypothetical protein